MTAEASAHYRRIATLPDAEARVVMQTKPDRLPPFVLSTPHEAVPIFHRDWTLVSRSIPNWQAKEAKLRDDRNQLIREKLEAKHPVWYPSSGNSMWPLVRSGDTCCFHPI